MASALTVSGLKKRYDNGVEALKGVSLSVEKGDFFALLGPNGAGKTTLINIASALVNKSGGTLAIEGVSIDEDPMLAKLHVGVVPQEFNFGIFEKVIDIVVNQAGYYGIPVSRAYPSAKKYLANLGLWEKRNEQARNLSGGMKRRLMIARGLVHEPTFLILDEPTAGVDLELRRGMWDFLRELNGNGVTILLTTHYLEEAEQLCRTVAIINHGEIVASGEIKKLLAGMERETLVIDLSRTLRADEGARFSEYEPEIGDHSIELTLTKQATLTKAFVILSELGVEGLSMRNKTNRLEEFFLQVTRKEPRV